MKMIRFLVLAGLLSLFSLKAMATIVQIQTSIGDIEVNLFDEATPETVSNFLYYVQEGAYTNTVIHRLVADFVVQGGGFALEEGVLDRNATVTSPPNEPVYSNLEGTIAMAKLGNDPDSATNQWFFNLADNSTNLDAQNGGFTVFGQVITGWDVVMQMNALQSYDLRTEALSPIVSELSLLSAFSSTPLRDYSPEELDALVAAPQDYLVMINSIEIIDSSVASAEGLSPASNSLISSGGGNEPDGEGGTEYDEPSASPKKKKKWYAAGDESLFLLLLLGALNLGYCRRSIKHAS